MDFKDGRLKSAELLLDPKLPARTVSLRSGGKSVDAELQPGIAFKWSAA
jgi:hypothetical protein